ncbi:MAG: metalloregulator ArsR/SmtB family transcription factor, partial [Gammaproteobacteria bacterium]
RIIAQRGEITATEIASKFSISAPAVSQHLKILREARLVQVKKQAQKRLYSIDQFGMNEVSSWILEVKKLWNKKFDSLDKYFADLKNKK